MLCNVQHYLVVCSKFVVNSSHFDPGRIGRNERVVEQHMAMFTAKYKRPLASEPPFNSLIIDPLRLSDGSPVVLKRVKLDSPEFEIAVLFSSPPLSLDPRNHYVPVIQALKYGEFGILVLPLLRKFDDPPFDTVREVIECFRQLFEGVQFMHQNFVVHRDCTKLNIMMDPTKLYPKGYIPERPYMKVDGSDLVSPSCTRTACWPRYYLIDFGHSCQYDPADGIPHEWVLREETKQRLSIATLTNWSTKSYFHPAGIGLDFLRPLVEDMVKENPSERPTIDDVVMRFDAIVKSLSRWRLQALTQLGNQPLFFPFAYVGRRLKFALMLKSPLPKIVASPSRVLSATRNFYTANRERVATPAA
ncbi:uncharacterized protein EV420DRAFT_1483684 [Desarmillaria tabescens]|uniref:Protein kinase domain-containing protein n=1 Tax=Armillaria tabescens TaxID=1929756 RepID=A0AA39JSU1_ARMTA|nr:uncharacterized protein EV420DRAFT_1483684 [Desarmillaria tabescens]KAK0447882.1 hypothetical protein EV420DRAFT_1483684 [Desarmillaria tabescens]